MSERQARLSDSSSPLGHLLPALSEALPFALRGDFGADMPGCGMPGMYLLREGRLWLRAGDMRVCLEAGDVVLWPTAVAHRLASDRERLDRYAGGDEAHADGVPVQTARGRSDSLAEVHVLKLGDAPLPRFVGLDRPYVLTRAGSERATASIAAALHAELAHEGADMEVIASLARALWLRALSGRVDLRSVDPGLLLVMQAVLDAPETVTSVAELAHRCGLSRSRLHDRFIACCGEPPGLWLRRVRMLRAQNLLQSAGLSVAEVAERFGYDSEAAFRKAYRKLLGVPARATLGT